VETRLASAYGKLGIRSRAELGAWMAARNMDREPGGMGRPVLAGVATAR
jgi:hypothetical protein